jgi:hypothetical protein
VQTTPSPHALRRRLSQETIQVLIDDYKAGAISPQLAA